MAKLTNDREPLITLEPFTYLRRKYKVGSVLDRRRLIIPLRRVRDLVKAGNLKLAADMTEEELKEFGYVYSRKYRFPLKKIDQVEKQTKSIMPVLVALDNGFFEAKIGNEVLYTLEPVKDGLFDINIDDNNSLNDNPVTLKEAQKLINIELGI